MIQIRFTDATWQNSPEATERAAAEHWASMIRSTCAVPGTYRAGSRRVIEIGPSAWMVNGVRLETRGVKS